MANSRVIATKKQGICMAHVCSVCGFPTISVVQIQATAQKTYTFSQSKAETIASKTAEKAIREVIRDIESCYQREQPLIGKQEESSMIAPGHFCTLSVGGFDSCCPMCLGIEPWQRTTSKKRMDELEKENFPIVFKNFNKAEQWAVDKIIEMSTRIVAKRENAIAVEQAIEKFKEERAQILIWVNELANLPEKVEYDRLNVELSVAKDQKARLGLFDFKLKRIVKRKIKLIESNLKRYEEDLKKKTESIVRRIVDAENQLCITQAIAFGVTNDILREKNGNAISYSFSPNEAPDDIIDEIENYVVQIKNGDQMDPSPQVLSDIPVMCSDETVFCRKCGFKTLPDSNFCTKCGSVIE